MTAERDRALTEVRQLSNTLHEQEQQHNQQVPATPSNAARYKPHPFFFAVYCFTAAVQGTERPT